MEPFQDSTGESEGGRSYSHKPQQTASSSLAVSLFTASSLPGHFWGNCFHLSSSSKAPLHARVHTHAGLGDCSLLLLDIPQNLACLCPPWHCVSSICILCTRPSPSGALGSRWPVISRWHPVRKGWPGALCALDRRLAVSTLPPSS